MAKDKLKDLVKKMQKIKHDAEGAIEKIKAKALNAQKKSFSTATKILFEQFPELENFSWTQYTAYWNDGSPCEFEANTESVEINGEYHCSYSIDEQLKNIKNKKKSKVQFEKELAEAKKKKEPDWKIDNIEAKIKDLEKDPVDLKKLYDMLTAVLGVLKCFNDEMLEEMFGDHVKVTVTKDGAETEEYEHD